MYTQCKTVSQDLKKKGGKKKKEHTPQLCVSTGWSMER